MYKIYIMCSKGIVKAHNSAVLVFSSTMNKFSKFKSSTFVHNTGRMAKDEQTFQN